jgi:hypothetical protein
MVICSRCHRTIPAGELAEHMRQHKGKLPMHLRSSTGSRSKTEGFERARFRQVYEEIFKARTTSKPVKSNLSESQIRAKFTDALKHVDAAYSSLRFNPTQEPEFIEVSIDENRNLMLKYSPLSLGTLTEEAINALLLHEACHVSTLPDTILRVPDVGDPQAMSFIANSFTNYDEYLAHVEFVKRFRSDSRYEALKELHISYFANFDTIIGSLKNLIDSSQKAGKSLNLYWVSEHLGAIAYDTMFFYTAGEQSFLEWCKDRSLDELGVFIGWIFEDFEHIRKLGLPRKETHDKVFISIILSISVNPLKLPFGQIKFAETAKGLHEDMMEKGRDADLVQLWEKRRQSR